MLVYLGRARRYFEWPWTLLSFGALAAVVLWQLGAWVTFDARQPVRFDRVEILNSPIRPGDPLLARVFREKVREDCPVTSERFAMNADGEALALGRLEWPGGPAGAPSLDVAYATPADLPDGFYTLRVRLTYHCPRGLDFDLVQPLTTFRVQAHPEARPGLPLGVVPPGLVTP